MSTHAIALIAFCAAAIFGGLALYAWLRVRFLLDAICGEDEHADFARREG